MNKIFKNYVSKLNLRETQAGIDYINIQVLEILKNKLDIFIVKEPKITIKKEPLDSIFLNNKRTINFDSANNSNIYFEYNEYRF